MPKEEAIVLCLARVDFRLAFSHPDFRALKAFPTKKKMEIGESSSMPQVSPDVPLSFLQVFRRSQMHVDLVCRPPHYSPPRIQRISSEYILSFRLCSPMHSKYYSPNHGY